jgi:hypothetical protein
MMSVKGQAIHIEARERLFARLPGAQYMSRKVFTKLAFVLAAAVGSISAAPCVTQTLAYYESNFGELSPCTLGALSFYSFDFGKLSAAGTVTPNDIMITPDLATTSLFFSGATATTFNHVVLAGQREQYLLSYIIDPPPIVAGDDLSLDPPTGPIFVSRWSCANQPFDPSPSAGSIAGAPVSSYATAYKCLGDGSNPYFLQVSPTTVLSQSVTFATPASYVFSRMAIDLFPGEISGLDAIVARTSTVPEPGTFVPAAIALAGLVFYRKRRR